MHVFGFFLFPIFFPFVGCGFLSISYPRIVACCGNGTTRFPSFSLNLFLGWSLIGWVVALIWACKSERVIYVQSPQRY